MFDQNPDSQLIDTPATFFGPDCQIDDFRSGKQAFDCRAGNLRVVLLNLSLSKYKAVF